eukprot:1326067-Amphidinium_carterae.1
MQPQRVYLVDTRLLLCTRACIDELASNLANVNFFLTCAAYAESRELLSLGAARHGHVEACSILLQSGAQAVLCAIVACLQASQPA